MSHNHIRCPGSTTLCILALIVSGLVTFLKSEELSANIFQKKPLVPIDDWIRQFGYPVENHEIQTEDGYLLTYHRIPHGKSGPSARSRHPVLVQHGLWAASASWVAVNQSLGFVLADAGYDVWMGNARGSEFSRKHIKYDPEKDKKEFFDFSWHEMGYYDLPAAIDYILNVTGHTQLFYAGHSMGTTMYFVLGATRPEYMDKVKAAALMSPVAYIRHEPSPVWRTANLLSSFLIRLYKLTGTYELLPFSESTHALVNEFCKEGMLQFLCRNLIFTIVGWDEEEFDKSLITTYLQYLPGGSSAKVLEHYSQVVKKDFRQFDYGFFGNIRKYKNPNPPKYDLSKVTSPVYIHYAANDWIIVPEDALYTASLLPNVKNTTETAHPNFNHADYMWATHVKTLVYDLIVQQFHSHR